MNNTERGGAKRNYYRGIREKRRHVIYVTPARTFFRRIGNFLDRQMGRFITIAVSSAAVTLIAGIAAFYIAVLPDRRGIERITVPDFEGRVYGDSFADTSIFDFSLEYRYDSGVPAGRVISQHPSAGSYRLIKKGEQKCEVTLTISLGTKTVLVPDCTGMESAEAELKLKSLGFEVEIDRQYSSTVAVGRVISSSPAAYSDHTAGGKVRLTVSLGEKLDMIIVPALTGLSESAAVTKLLSVGLLLGQVEYVKSSSPAGTVVGQSAPFGSEARQGTRVSLTVSLGP